MEYEFTKKNGKKIQLWLQNDEAAKDVARGISLSSCGPVWFTDSRGNKFTVNAN